MGQPFGSAIGRHISQLNKQAIAVQQQLLNVRRQTKRQQLQQSMAEIEAQQHTVTQAQTTYHQALHRITQTLHPFSIQTLEWQLFDELSTQLKEPSLRWRLWPKLMGGRRPRQRLTPFPSMAQGIHAWWRWVSEALPATTTDLDVQEWVLLRLLPWVYWQQQADKTRHPELKADYHQAAQQAYSQLADHPMTQQMDPQQGQQWVEWAQWMCTKYQRTSSAVEGRNGYLSRLHHAGRGVSQQTLKGLTILHNFDLKRADGTTSAQRLFGHSFPDVFEWVVNSMGELPVARRLSKTKSSNSLPLAIFPA